MKDFALKEQMSRAPQYGMMVERCKPVLQKNGYIIHSTEMMQIIYECLDIDGIRYDEDYRSIINAAKQYVKRALNLNKSKTANFWVDTSKAKNTVVLNGVILSFRENATRNQAKMASVMARLDGIYAEAGLEQEMLDAMYAEQLLRMEKDVAAKYGESA